MGDAIKIADLIKGARAQSGLTQRALAKRARTTQSVVARIELGVTSPTWGTIENLLAAAGFEVVGQLQRIPVLDPQALDDVPRILQLSPEDRLREVANISRFKTAARRV